MTTATGTGSKSKYPDTMAFRASTDRQTVARVTCGFVATGSGSYYSRSCMNLAAWVAVYVGQDGTRYRGDYPTLRCHKHRAIDERTASRRGYGERVYDAFDGAAIAAELDGEKAAAAEVARLSQLREAIEKYALAILTHAELATDERQALKHIAADAKAGTLVVK
jgi:hypothetical protein